MGVVYEALDTRLGRTVALKILADDIDAPEQLLREAELAASLEHENIVPIYEANEHDGIAYFTMKHIEGGPLVTPVPGERRAAEIGVAIARAIAFAHRHGILHLDLKPGNVLVDPDGRPFVADFGLATRDGMDTGAELKLGGTPLYMAPEVWRGEPRAASTAADVWGVGALLYEMLTGLPPFHASSRDELMKRVTTEAPAPLVGVSVDLAAVCLRCLEKDPANRYMTAADLVADMERFLDGEPVEARPRARSLYLTVRHPVVFVLMVMFVIAASLFVISQSSLLRTEQTVFEVANVTAASVAASTAMQLEDYAAAVEVSSRDPRVMDAFGDGTTTPAEVCKQLANEHAWPSSAWFLLDSDGKLIGRAPDIEGEGRAHAFTFRDYYVGADELDRQGKRTTYISRAYRSEVDGDFKIALSIAVRDKSTRRVGLLVATLATGSMLGAIALPEVEGKNVSMALLGPRDLGDMEHGPMRSDAANALESVILVQSKLDRGAEVPVHVGAHREMSIGRSAYTRVEPVPGTHFSVLVRVASDDREPQITMEPRL